MSAQPKMSIQYSIVGIGVVKGGLRENMCLLK